MPIEPPRPARPHRRLPMVAGLLVVAGGHGGTAFAADTGQATQISPAAASAAVGAVSAAAAQLPVEVTSEGAEVSKLGDALLKGKVHLKQGTRTLTAENAQYLAKSGDFSVSGNVEYTDTNLKVSGQTAVWDPTTGASFGNAKFELPARPARGDATTIAVSNAGNLSLRQVRFTGCPVGNDSWVLKAGEITIDQAAQQGTGRNVRLDFQGVPILYTPFISFPVSDARKSGLLFPEFGNSNKSGLELAAPYYFNLAPNYDATVTPRIFTRRGAQLGTELRYLGQHFHSRFEGEWIPHDSLAGRDRSYAHLTHLQDLTPRLRLDIDAANASDVRYFEDFGLGTEGTSISYVERSVRLTYLDRHWKAVGLVQDFQTIDRTVPEALRPYSRVPQLTVQGRWRTPLLDYQLRGEFVNFARRNGVEGSRLDLEPTLEMPLRSAGRFLIPSIGLHATQYSLKGVASGADRSPSRVAPAFTLDSGLVFERELSGGRVQTLEPRALYTYVPYRNQDAIPLFDTGLPDLRLERLFDPQRYVGGDRLADANQVALGITSRLLDNDTGRQLLQATFGQVRYFAAPRIGLPGEPPPRASASDLIGELSVAAFGKWSVDVGVQWDPAAGKTVRRELALQYRADGGRIANLAYRYREGRLEQLDFSTAWPVSASWNVFARQVYSLRDRTAIESFAGLEFKDCCWKLRVVARRYVSSRTGERDTAIGLQLELNGLSSVGVPTGAFLERSIRGYKATDPRP